MTTPIIIVAALLVLVIAACVRQIRRLKRDVATLSAKTPALEGGTTEQSPSDNINTRLRALEVADRRRQQAEAERSRP